MIFDCTTATSDDQSILDKLAFRWSWRSYQERVLQSLSLHLSDNKLHLVAAPGAGKTSLGIELFRKLGKPALILSPTRTIRDQWILRLDDFLPKGSKDKPWVSRDIRSPALYTSITYQALHRAYRDEVLEEEIEPDSPAPAVRELEVISKNLKKRGIKTLILDEAHHLTQEWWKALQELSNRVEIETLVSLTATPPYEVTSLHWQRYEELCGPIDEEISVPELVKCGTLCPHQDYVYGVISSKANNAELRQWENQVQEILDLLDEDKIFRQAIFEHPWLKSQEIDEILEHPEFWVALLIFIRHYGGKLESSWLDFLSAGPDELPEIGRRWWQIIIYSYLFSSHWKDTPTRDAHVEFVKKELRKRDLLHRRELRINSCKKVQRSLALTNSKVNACADIYIRERKIRGNTLRQVILADYIREEETRQLGAYPVFRSLVLRDPKAACSMALLTGRLVMIHKSRLESFSRYFAQHRIRIIDGPTELPEFVEVNVSGENSEIVAAITNLLQSGRIQVVVGTHALLGEGWDAPAINSLILASAVGSYVLTNQMRGRAIRSIMDDPNKVASIWHLVSFDLASELGLEDYLGLKRRFGMFVGLDEKELIIESGIQRLRLPNLKGVLKSPNSVIKEKKGIIDRYREQQLIKKLNKYAFQQHEDLFTLKSRWNKALDLGEGAQVRPALDVEKPRRVRPVIFTDTLKKALIVLLAWFAFAFELSRGVFLGDEWTLLLVIAIFLALCSKPLWRVLRLWLLYLPIGSNLRQLAFIVRDALSDADIIKSDIRRTKVSVEQQSSGVHSIFLSGGTFQEQAIFADCMRELLGPIDNPRYLVVRSEFRRFGVRTDFHAVPRPLAEKKELAELFLSHWLRRLGKADIIFTRSIEGRKKLLSARLRSLSGQQEDRTKRKDRWA